MRSSRAGGEFLHRFQDAVARGETRRRSWNVSRLGGGLQSVEGRKFRGKGAGAAGVGLWGGWGGGLSGALWLLECLLLDSVASSACMHLLPPPSSPSAQRSPVHPQTQSYSNPGQTSMLTVSLLTPERTFLQLVPELE